MRAALRLIPVWILSACTGLDGADHSYFRPIGNNAFEFHATSDLFYSPGAQSWAETQRLSWLANYVGLSGLCPNGYWIESRETTFVYVTTFGYPVDNIVYRGRCAG
jgi:hypothetical protein